MPFEFTNNKSMHEIEMHEKTENARKTHFVVTFVVMNFSFLKETRFVGALRAPPRSLRLPRERPIFLKGISLTKAVPVAQICPNLHKIVPSS